MYVGRLADIPALMSLGHPVSGVETSHRRLMDVLRTSTSQGLPRDVIYSSETFHKGWNCKGVTTYRHPTCAKDA